MRVFASGIRIEHRSRKERSSRRMNIDRRNERKYRDVTRSRQIETQSAQNSWNDFVERVAAAVAADFWCKRHILLINSLFLLIYVRWIVRHSAVVQNASQWTNSSVCCWLSMPALILLTGAASDTLIFVWTWAKTSKNKVQRPPLVTFVDWSTLVFGSVISLIDRSIRKIYLFMFIHMLA